MKIGMNLLLWTDDPTGEGFLPLCGRLHDAGFDGVELPVFRFEKPLWQELGRRLEDLGLERTGVTVCPEDADPISADAGVRAAAVDRLRGVLDSCEAAGIRLLCGPFYAALGRFSGRGPTTDEWQWGVDSLRQVAAHAEQVGVTLACEFLNRFEIYLLNTAAEATRFAREVGSPGCGVLYDTFHAHIEERDPAAAIRACGERLLHVHISENDRGTPGSGQVAWEPTFRALRAAGYDGWLTIESFGHRLEALVAATKIWRPLFEDEEQLAREGLAFIRRCWAEAGATAAR